MKLFLDDIRLAPEGYTQARTYQACIELLCAHEFERVSLDYSLGERQTGLDVLKWMVENDRIPPQLNIHSTHDYGRSAMADYIRRNFPAGYVFSMSSR